MVLQRGLVVVHQSQRVRCLDQKVVVEAAMLKIVNQGRPVASQVKRPREGIGFEQAAMAQQHVGHLQHRGHMDAVVVGVGGVVALLNPA